MRLAITGGTGFVGGFIAAAALRAGHDVILLSRKRLEGLAGPCRFRQWQLGEAPDLSSVDALIHAAFAHVPGRFRGGEGDDPAGFLLANRDGSLRLFEAARKAGVASVLQLSSRAVFDGYPAGTLLTEDLAPRPASLYGEIKAELEAALCAEASPRFRGISLRATGVYGLPAVAGQPHKWAGLIAEIVAGRAIPARVSTEVHGGDLARAALLLLEVARGGDFRLPQGGFRKAGGSDAAIPMVAHASDIILDHRDLTLAVSRILGRRDIPLPPRCDATRLSILDCSNLHRLGWQPAGWPALERSLAAMVAALPQTRHDPASARSG